MSTANTVNRLEDRAGVPMTISNPQLQLAEELLQETIPPIKALQNLFDYATNISKLSSPPISELRREEKRGSELSQNRRLRKIDQFPTHSPSVYPQFQMLAKFSTSLTIQRACCLIHWLLHNQGEAQET
jgi:hypothetical protein